MGPVGPGGQTGPAMDAPTRPPDSTRYRVVVTVLLAVAAALVGLAVWAADTEDPAEITVSGGGGSTGSGTVVESTLPRDGAEALRQTAIQADLATGYDGTLTVNGVEVPEGELVKEPNLGLLGFTPGDGKAVERLDTGRNCVVVTYWKLAEGRDGPARGTYQWCFDVT